MSELASGHRLKIPSASALWNETAVPSVRAAWERNGRWLMWAAVVLMSIAAGGRLTKGFYRLLIDSGPTGAIDLRLYHRFVLNWFAGRMAYGDSVRATYPPATYPILWLFVGWLDVSSARWLWGLITVAALGWLIVLVLRESRAQRRLDRIFIALLPLAITGGSVAIGNGQLAYLVLPALLTGLLLVVRGADRRAGILGAGLALAAFVKPSISVPFIWIVCFAAPSLIPAVIVVAGYGALTFLAASFQPVSLVALIRAWLERGALEARTQGYANVHNWLSAVGLEKWSLSVALLGLAGLGIWTYRRRHGDEWLLIGAAALVARLWTYHFVYDDVVILVPLIALYRLAGSGPASGGRDVAAGLLFAIGLAASLAPARIVNLPPPWSTLYDAGQTAVWASMLVFFLVSARSPMAAPPTEAGLT